MDWEDAVMEPEEFLRLTKSSYNDLADLCDRDVSNIRKWFYEGPSQRKPHVRDKRILYLAYHLMYPNA